jgi:hypothetical protein
MPELQLGCVIFQPVKPSLWVRTWHGSTLACVPSLSLPNPYVHLRGYASHLGFVNHPGGLTDAQLNVKLSLARCEAVKAKIKTYNSATDFPEEIPIGDAESTGTIRNDDGYWRAVDVYVFNKKPVEPPKPVPPPGPAGSTQWRIRVFKGAGASIVIFEGDAIVFQIVDDVQGQCGVFYYLGAGISIPGLKVSTPGSISNASPFVEFTTIRPVFLDSFTGEASFYQNPGASIGPYSVGGTILGRWDCLLGTIKRKAPSPPRYAINRGRSRGDSDEPP